MTASAQATKRAPGGKAATTAARDGRVVRVSLYGGLSRLMPVRPVIVNAPNDATVRWVVDELSRSLGPLFTEGVMHSAHEKRGVCRIFLDGLPVELDDAIPPGEDASDVDLIVLTAIEGG